MAEESDAVDGSQYHGSGYGQTPTYNAQTARDVSGFPSHNAPGGDYEEEPTTYALQNKGYNKTGIAAGGLGGAALVGGAAYGYHEYEHGQEENGEEDGQQEEYQPSYQHKEQPQHENPSRGFEAEDIEEQPGHYEAAEGEGHASVHVEHLFEAPEDDVGEQAYEHEVPAEHESEQPAYEHQDYTEPEQAPEADQYEHSGYQQKGEAPTEHEYQHYAERPQEQ